MKLSKEDILRLFNELNSELCKDGISGELYLMGGAVMCLSFNARASTKDIDCLFEPSQMIRQKAKQIAAKQKLNENWLNDGVKAFLSDKASFEDYLNLSNLKVLTCTPEYLLAMKCLAMRLGQEFQDEDDVRFLIRYLNLENFEQVVEVICQYYPKDKFPQKTFYAIQELLEKK